MLKPVTTKTQFGSCILHFALCLLLVLLSACAEGPDSSDEASSDTGSIVFSIVWGDATNQESAVIQQAQFHCPGNGVEWIEATVLDQNDELLVSGDRWRCTQGEGTITGVPVGDDRKVVVFGKNSELKVWYEGESSRFPVTASGPNDAGTITMHCVGPVWYVDAAVASSGDGKNWSRAFKTIQEAIDAADAGDEIWVKQGTYNLYDQIKVNKAVSIYAGFDGTESQRDQRNWQNNVTTVDAKNAVRCFYVSADATIDGFTVTGGNAEGYGDDNVGGGMYNNDHSSPIVTNCTFSGNSAGYGGGMCNAVSSIEVTNCTFINNHSGWTGGGMCNGPGSPKVTNCTFSGNSAGYGGGIANYDHSSPIITNCIFSENYANFGGGIDNRVSSSPVITNCTFIANWVGLGVGTAYGGGIHNWDYSSPNVTNCTFTGNTAKDDGGCMASYGYSSPTVTNCIMWGDSAPNGSEIRNDGISSTTVTYSDVEGGYGGDGNKNEDPLFVGSGNYHLQAVSPCMDAGDSDALPTDTADLDGDGDTDEPVPFDLDGNPRIVGTVDMGAYETQPPSPPSDLIIIE